LQQQVDLCSMINTKGLGVLFGGVRGGGVFWRSY